MDFFLGSSVFWSNDILASDMLCTSPHKIFLYWHAKTKGTDLNNVLSSLCETYGLF